MPKTILLVEDEYAALEMLTLLLGQAGYRVVEASDGEEALARLAETRPDLVVTDYWMPRMDGLELCRRMEADERWRHIPVVMMSASVFDGPRPPQVVAFLTKPLLFDGILEVLGRLLGPA